MQQFLQLGPEVTPGVREITSSHFWKLLPRPLSEKRTFVPLKGHGGARNIVTDYCWADGKLILKAPIMRRLREERRKTATASTVVWGASSVGYGNSFRWFNYAVMKGLTDARIPLRFLLMGTAEGKIDFARVRGTEDLKDTVIILNSRWKVAPEHIQRCARYGLAVLGYFQCEGTLVNRGEIDFMQHFDAMLATSTVTKKAIEDAKLGAPVHVFGHGIDPLQFPYLDHPVGRRPYTFFHFADVQARKGTDILIQSFKRLPQKDVRLYIKAQWENPESHEYRKQTTTDPRVIWDFKRYAPEELQQLIGQMDCGVFPSRGEGFGLPKLECEATGLPCIATRAHGYLDTSIEEGTIFINVKEWKPAFIDGGVMAEPDGDHLLALMNQCAGDPEWAKRRGQVASRNAHAYWKWSDKIAELRSILRLYGLK